MSKCEQNDHPQKRYDWLVSMLALLLLIATLLLPNLYLNSSYFPRDIQAETPVRLGEIAEIDKISISHQQDHFGPFINLNMTGQFHHNLTSNDKFIISTRVGAEIKEFDFTFLIKKQLTNKNCEAIKSECNISFSHDIYIPFGTTAESLHIIIALHINQHTINPIVMTEEIKLYLITIEIQPALAIAAA